MENEIKGKIYIVDDDTEMQSMLRDFLTTQGYQTSIYSSAIEALKNLSSKPNDVDIIISDIKMPQMDGLEFTSELKKILPEIPIILITAFGSIETAIEAMRKGAYHYIVKPFKLAEMSVNLERAFEYRRLQRENTVLKQEIKRSFTLGGLLGKSQTMQSVFDLINRVSNATANVLITGESGTGKEMVARAIHQNGPRAAKPFIAINCTAIPETLLESELFGHAKGSFTGAIQRKKGLFEEAEGGTLFLDEIGDMDPYLQTKLLRVIQEKKLRPVGDNISKDIDVRLISATHKDLKTAIREGRFREDLFYRLSVIPIVIPPLRHRKEDIPLLAEFFFKKYAATNGAKAIGFSKKAINKLINLKWEGNVRELENMIERAIVLCKGPQIDDTDIPSPETLSSEEFFVKSTG
ncbi:MAG: sigma-54-dependent Fis family transcriptional regulator, partial [Deltaproteobacteria bacterium]|nr:sigma-54-dependent Fis family transcriptional regulator [Deltaproteobacteria bacterium]